MVGRFVCAEIVILLLCGAMGRIVLCPLRAWSARPGVPSGLAPWIVLALLAPLPLAWPGPSFRAAMVTLLFVMSWKAASQDIDLGTEDTLWSERAFLLVSALLSFWNPVFLLANLWTQFSVFDAFKHHGTLPLRFLMIGCAICGQWTLMSALGFGGDLAPGLLTLVSCHAMAYGLPALGKAQLGPRWYSWMLDNRLHYIIASAFSWGWLRFLPERVWIGIVNRAAVLTVPFQIVAFGLETTALVEIVDHQAPLVVTVWAAIFHLMVFFTTGILFWEWAFTGLVLFWMVRGLDPQVSGVVFGPHMLVPALAVMGGLWLLGKIWRPQVLAWWDTPFTQRVHWQVRGESGKLYGLYSDFFCPHERLYGRVHGYFMTDEKICTEHLGEVKDRQQRDLIWSCEGDPLLLGGVKDHWGRARRNKSKSAQHRDYLLRLMVAYNAGRRKSVYPRWLRWLKAPGGQFYYWGRTPRFRGQERAARVIVSYREEYFDGRAYNVITDRVLEEIEIPAGLEDGRQPRRAAASGSRIGGPRNVREPN
jgi:hypothetical protein